MTTKNALWLTWVAIIAGIVSYAVAQQTAPSEIQGCIVVSAAPAYTAGQRVAFTCDLTGKFRTGGTP